MAIQILVSTADASLRELLERPWSDIASQARLLPGGRGGIWELPGGLLLRRCRRGGALGKLLGDRYASPETALEEQRLASHLLKEGVGVAEVVAVRAERARPGWKLDVVTRRIEDATPLRDLLPAAPVADVARAVRRMHDRGLWHADLNLQNVLVTKSGDVRIIDLAGSKVKRPLPESARLDNIARLYRSLVKQGLRASPVSLVRFLMVYFVRDRAAVKRAIAACRAKMRRHRLWWAIAGK